ncbi:15-hydroxyprostaglandin dehydrogenase [NAD(+)]-like [Sitodiplosis mosellana]|uniref:15-hydroxyprostaglandin dehydrogenase [NAD(+)]-like n=1 Tax=Sitodiplosis mosellana TaxID=263140 RepID=UPI00244510B7|nr:15-hydroxyprostaglandin dehydrogenase [NAD(+)]-like [Sitodiplosis mosellana]
MTFENQNFIVVGGAKLGGIGLKFIRELFLNGVENVATFDICDLSDAIAELKSEFPDKTLLFNKVDVRKQAEIETAFKDVVNAFGHVDILANFAGIFNEQKPMDVIEINLLGVIYATLIGIDHMSIAKGGRGGTILNMASICGLDPFFWGPVYCASKHGVVGFTKSLAEKELESELGIKFIIICPGFTETTLLTKVDSTLYGQNVASERPQDIYGIQTVDQCAKGIVEVMKKSKNGEAWILSKGYHKKVDFQLYYKNN